MTGWRVVSMGCVAALVVGCLSSRTSWAEAGQPASWPQFHGPRRDNVSDETGLLKKWPPGGPKLRWTANGLGFGYSSVSVADGRIFTAGNIDDNTVVTALDLAGRTLWQMPNGRAWKGEYPGTRGTPTIDGARVYHEGPHGGVAGFDAETGEKMWSVNILEKFQSKNIRWALSESLLIDGDRVICCPGGPVTCVVALNKKTGDVVWQSPSADDWAGYASPILVERQGLRMIITLTSRAVVGVNADTGELLWKEKYVSLFDENVLCPVYDNGEIFVSCLKAGSVKWRINIDGKKASLQEVWRSNEMDNHHGGAVLVDGHVYGSSCIYNHQKWICLDWKTGEKKYAARGVGKGSLTSAEGLLYTLSERRVMGLVRATPAGHQVVSQFTIPSGGRGASWAHPVVCGGRLYIRYDQYLYAYDVRAEQ